MVKSFPTCSENAKRQSKPQLPTHRMTALHANAQNTCFPSPSSAVALEQKIGIVLSVWVISCQEDQLPGGRGGRGSAVNILTPSRCQGRGGPRDHGHVLSAAVACGRGAVTEGKVTIAVPVMWAPIRAPVPPRLTELRPAWRARLPGWTSTGGPRGLEE